MMTRRATILTALCAVLVMASGAMGIVEKEIDLEFLIEIDSSAFSDTAIVEFGVGNISDYTEIVGKIYRVTADSIFAKDTVTCVLQTKCDHDSDLTWYSLFSTSKFEDGGVDNPGEQLVEVQMSDSSASVFNYFRWLFIFNCDDDSTGDHGATFDWNAKYRAHLFFRQSGEPTLVTSTAELVDSLTSIASLIATLVDNAPAALTQVSTLDHDSVGQTLATTPLAVAEHKTLRVHVEWNTGADTADLNTHKWAVQYKAANTAERWRISYAQDTVTNDSTNYPVVFNYTHADSLFMDSVRVVFISDDEGTATNVGDNPHAGAAPSFRVRIIATKE